MIKEKLAILLLLFILTTAFVTSQPSGSCNAGESYNYYEGHSYYCNNGNVIDHYEREGWVCGALPEEWVYLNYDDYSIENTCRTDRETTSSSVDYTCSGDTKVKEITESGTNYKGCSAGSCSSSTYSTTTSVNQGSCPTGSSCGSFSGGSWSTYSHYCSGNDVRERQRKTESRSCTNYQGCSSGSCSSSSYTDYNTDYRTRYDYSCSTGSGNYGSYSDTGDKTCSGDQPRKKQSRGYTDYLGCGGGNCDSARRTETRWVDAGSSCKTGVSGTSWSGNLYCDGGDVVEDGTYTDYNGCSSGSCSETVRTETRTVETCPDGCSSGECVDAPVFEGLSPSGEGVDPSPNLSVVFEHRSGRDVTVTFENADTGGVIDSKTVSGSVGDVSTVEVVWGGADGAGESYGFEVVLDDGVNTRTDSQGFRIVRRPGQPFDPWPPDGSGQISPR